MRAQAACLFASPSLDGARFETSSVRFGRLSVLPVGGLPSQENHLIGKLLSHFIVVIAAWLVNL
jgi:hypothetical protein